MENEILNKILSEIKDLKASQAKLEEGQQRIETKIDTFKEQFNEHEAKDANRHLEILGVLSELRTDITTLEDISGKNLRDIATLKRAK